MLLGNEINPPTHSTHTRPSWMCGSGEEEALNPALLSRISLSIMDDDTHMLRAAVKATGPPFKCRKISVEASPPRRENGALGLFKQGVKPCGCVVIKPRNSDWDSDPGTKQTGTWTHILLAETVPQVSGFKWSSSFWRFIAERIRWETKNHRQEVSLFREKHTLQTK